MAASDEMTEARAIEIVKWGVVLARPAATQVEFREALAYIKKHKLEDKIRQSELKLVNKKKK